jgi:hypothetical protein
VAQVRQMIDTCRQQVANPSSQTNGSAHQRPEMRRDVGMTTSGDAKKTTRTATTDFPQNVAHDSLFREKPIETSAASAAPYSFCAGSSPGTSFRPRNLVDSLS